MLGTLHIIAKPGWGFERRLIIKGDRNLGVASCGASCTLQDEQGNILLKMLGMFPGDWHI